MESDVTAASNTYRDQVIMWVKDASRAIDYADSNKPYSFGWVRSFFLCPPPCLAPSAVLPFLCGWGVTRL